jgi:hypothetical protein
VAASWGYKDDTILLLQLADRRRQQHVEHASGETTPATASTTAN